MTNAEWATELEELRNFFNTHQIPEGQLKSKTLQQSIILRNTSKQISVFVR